MNLIKEKDGHRLYGNMNTWDTNYHLIDEYGNDYLIDIGDVATNEEDYEEYELSIMWEDLKELWDIEYIKEIAWKVDEVNDTLGLRNALDKITIL